MGDTKTTVPVKEVDKSRFDEMLGIAPSVLLHWRSALAGEPVSYRECIVTGRTRPTYQAFFKKDGKFFESESPMTGAEFRRLKTCDLL